MNYFLCLLFFCNSFYGITQGFIPYFNVTSEAEWHFDNGRFDEAELLYEKAFKLVKTPKPKDAWLLARIYYGKGKQRKAYSLLKNSIKASGGLSSNEDVETYLKKDGMSLTDKQTKKLNSYRKDTTTEKFVNDLIVSKIIDSMHIVDQHVLKKSSGKDSIWWVTDTDSIYVLRQDKAKEIQHAHAEVLLQLFKDERLINNTEISPVSFGILLIHLSYEDFIIMEEYLLKMLDFGTLDPYRFARVKDRVSLDNGKCTNYFAFPAQNADYSCISYNEILENRKSIGLSIYYSSPTFDFYITPYKMGKIPFKEYYESTITGGK